jgi:hypothetical protein
LGEEEKERRRNRRKESQQSSVIEVDTIVDVGPFHFSPSQKSLNSSHIPKHNQSSVPTLVS